MSALEWFNVIGPLLYFLASSQAHGGDRLTHVVLGLGHRLC